MRFSWRKLKKLRLIVSCPVIQKVSKRVVCIFKILNLKFWNFGFIRCKIGGNALTQRARGRWPRALPGSVQSHRSPMPLPNFVQSHRSPMPLPNFRSGRRRRGPCCGASVGTTCSAPSARAAPGPWCGASVGTTGSAPSARVRFLGFIPDLFASKARQGGAPEQSK